MFSRSSTLLLLPRGLFDADGRCHRSVGIRPLTGQQEAVVAELGERPGAADVSRLLRVCLESIGGYSPVELPQIQALARGDRQFLLLQLRRLLSGDTLPLVVRCPNPACHALADLDLSVGELLTEAKPGKELIEVQTAEGDFRLCEPTGADDEALELLPGAWRDRAGQLWDRLILDRDGKAWEGGWEKLKPATRAQLAMALGDQSCGPDLVVFSSCPACAAMLEVVLDPMMILMRELRTGVERLLAEVHSLAWHYHWSEAQILDLPRARRWHYLELIRSQVEGSTPQGWR